MRRSPLTSIALCGALLAAGWTGVARAQGEVKPLRLSLGYEGRLIFKVLDIQVEEQASGADFSADSELTSAGILAALKHIHQHASSRGRIVGGQPQPGVFDTQSLAGKTRRRIRTAWSGAEVAMTADPPFSDLGDPPASLAQKLAAADPLTVLIRMTLKGTRQTACDRAYLFFDGKQLYALDFGPPGDAPQSARDVRLGLVGGFRCDVRFREVAGFHKKPPEKQNQGLQRPIHVDFATLGAGGPLMVTALHSETPIGSASIELSRVRVNASPAAETAKADGTTHGGAPR